MVLYRPEQYVSLSAVLLQCMSTAADPSPRRIHARAHASSCVQRKVSVGNSLLRLKALVSKVDSFQCADGVDKAHQKAPSTAISCEAVFAAASKASRVVSIVQIHARVVPDVEWPSTSKLGKPKHIVRRCNVVANDSGEASGCRGIILAAEQKTPQKTMWT